MQSKEEGKNHSTQRIQGVMNHFVSNPFLHTVWPSKLSRTFSNYPNNFEQTPTEVFIFLRTCQMPPQKGNVYGKLPATLGDFSCPSTHVIVALNFQPITGHSPPQKLTSNQSCSQQSILIAMSVITCMYRARTDRGGKDNVPLQG